MPELEMGDNAPAIPITLTFDKSLEQVVASGGVLHEPIRQAVAQSISELTHVLGVPGLPVVEIDCLQEEAGNPERFLHMSVNGHVMRHSNQVHRAAYSYVHARQLDPEATPSTINAWLSELTEDHPDMVARQGEDVALFFKLVCWEIISKQPAALLGPSQVQVYAATLPTPERTIPWPPHPGELLRVLGEVLDLRISISDTRQVAKALVESNGKSHADTVETLIAALRPQVIEIHLPREYLRQLTTAGVSTWQDNFPSLRDDLFVELGLTLAPFRFVPDSQLKPNSFAFKFNHLETMPWTALVPEECLVNDTVDRLTLQEIKGRPVLNPATLYPNSIVDSKHKSQLEASGLTTWDPMGYMVLALAQALRKHGACFIDRQSIQAQLEQLDNAFPAVVKAAKSTLSLEQMTRVLRGLIAEEISIRNLRLILERMLDYDYAAKESLGCLVLDDGPTSANGYSVMKGDPLRTWLNFVRVGLKRQISYKFARSSNTLVAYLLDPEIERLVRTEQIVEGDAVSLPETTQTSLVNAIFAEMKYLPPTARVPCILTEMDIRQALQHCIAPEIPQLSVVSYQELSPDLNIRPVARISLSPK